MNYEAIILDLGNRIAQLTIDNAVLLSRVQDEMKNKEEVEKQYVELLTKMEKVKTDNNVTNTKTEDSKMRKTSTDMLQKQQVMLAAKGGRF